MRDAEIDGEQRISALLDEIESCVSHGLLRVGIMAALAIPDIGGAMDSGDGKSSLESYAVWFDRYVRPGFMTKGHPHLDGNACYRLRCSMLHQGQMRHSRPGEYRAVFVATMPQIPPVVNTTVLEKSKLLLIEPRAFCLSMVSAGYEWLEAVRCDPLFKTNSKCFLDLLSVSFVAFGEDDRDAGH